MLSKQVVDGINDQINQEFFAWYSYLQMASYCESRSLPGFAKWLKTQAAEEQAHAMKLFDFLAEWGGEVILKPIEKPKQKFKTVREVFEAALEQERKNEKRVNELYETAFTEKAYAAQLQLQWFVTEQVEEVHTAEAVVEQLNLAGDNGAALLMLDREMGSRAGA